MFAEIIHINGIVQGVGFRPFIYNLAKRFSLKGWILNSSNGVEIHIEGDLKNIELFKNNIIKSTPPLSLINSFISSKTTPLYLLDFSIKNSISSSKSNIFISPDIATCRDCSNEILAPNNKRYFYPFTNCTNCGPRFSIIKALPYDRKVTTMSKFSMCKSCAIEYSSKDNRRFHAQPNCCPTCGPKLLLLDKSGNDLSNLITKDNYYFTWSYNKLIIDFFTKKILLGDIFAIKSLSGFHLCCDAFNRLSVINLRKRKKRPTKPFALMMRSTNEVNKLCFLSEKESLLLESTSRPIVILKKRENTSLPTEVSPNNNYIGVMLPSTPLHILIFANQSIKALVMTSGNLSSLPLEYENDSAIKNLSNFADYFMVHTRDIYLPIDDSICKVINDRKTIIRRGRGYAPSPYYFPGHNEILSLGANMKSTFSISKNDYIFTSSHCGDLVNYESISRYEKNIYHFLKIFNFKPKYIACDIHPEYESSKISTNFDLPIIKIQHHHAHIVSCMVDNNYTDKVIGIAFDGTGLGTDNNIWGSEFLICDYKNFKRVGHLEYTNFIGGNSSLSDGSKTALSYLYNIYKSYNNSPELLKYLNLLYKDTWKNIFLLLDNKVNTYNSSSMGRLFDGVSSLLDLCQKSTFEGEGAIILESLLSMDSPSNSYGIKINVENDKLLLSVTNLITQILKDIIMDTPPEIISLKFHSTIINYITSMCTSLREIYDINTIALSGGVFQNTFILENSIKELKKLDFTVLSHNNIPTNDGGISVGQLVIAKYKI